MKAISIVQKTRSIVRPVNRLLGYAGGLCILAITGIVSYEVFFRYVLNKPPIWAFDICSYLLLVVAVCSGVYAMEEDRHISFEMLTDRLRGTPLRIVLSIGYLFGLLYCGVLLSESIQMSWMSIERNIYTFAQVRIPDVILYGVIVIGAFFLFMTFLLKGIIEILFPRESR